MKSHLAMWLLLIATMTGCSREHSSAATPEPTHDSTRRPLERDDGGATTGSPSPVPVARTVTAQSVSYAWPLTVESAILRCRGPARGAQALTVEVAGREHALNGQAKSAGYMELLTPWREDPANRPARVPISGLVADARALCALNPPGVALERAALP